MHIIVELTVILSVHRCIGAYAYEVKCLLQNKLVYGYNNVNSNR